MTSYIALIRKDAGSDYGVDFPDFPGCVAAGHSLEEARRMAAEALSLHVEGMTTDKEAIPEPSSLDNIMRDRANRDAVAFLVDALAHPATQEQHALFDAFARSLAGLPVSHAWRGYGSAIFLEFGALTPSRRVRPDGSFHNPMGELSLMIQWSWRIEGKRSILCGSWSDEQRWPRALACLTKATVAGATLFGRLPEIDLALSNGLHVVSFMTAPEDPQWTIFDRRGERVRWLQVKRALLEAGQAELPAVA